jgi:hypothetical protein
MATTKQDLRQIEAKIQDFEQLGRVSGTGLDQIVESIDTDLDFPLKISATFPVADSKLHLANTKMTAADGVNKVVPPVKKQIFPNLASMWIDFQAPSISRFSSATDFDVTWPATNTVGKFRHVCLTLISSGDVKILFSDEAVSESALVNPGGLFVTGGLPIGYVTLECTDVLGYFKTSGSVTSVIENAKVFRFGSGAGGGAGTGDANSFTENLKHRLINSFYEFVTPVIFETDEQTLTSSATAAFDIVDGAYSFTAASQNFVSVQMMCEEFLENDDDCRRVELHTEWISSVMKDSNASWQASLNGTDFEVVTMTQQGLSNKLTGDKVLAIPTSVSLFPAATIVDTQTTELNATTLQSIATQFSIPSGAKRAINQLVVKVVKTGAPLGSYVISIVKDNSGSPTGEVLHSQIALNSSLSVGTNTITLSNFRKILTSGSSYWILVETDAAYKSSFVTSTTRIGMRSEVAVSGPTHKIYSSISSTWSNSVASMYYSLLGHGYDLRVKVVSSTGSTLDPKKLKAFGIFYSETVGSVVTGSQSLQKFIVNGDSNITQFTITQFLPSPDFLKIYDINTGQVYRYPAFNLNGHTVEFASGTFLVPGATVELLFDQSEGTGYDYSDVNASLLAANHLGSVDPTIDKSSAGRGIFLKRPDGTLREICIDDSDNIVIYSTP